MIMALILCVSPGEGRAENWADHRQVGAFQIRSEFPLRDERRLLEEMEDLGNEIEETLGIAIQGEGTEILLFGSRRSYQEYLAERVPDGVNRPALFVKIGDVSRVYAYRCPELATNLRHEATHALLHASLAIVPLWLDEGLAEYFEVPAEQRSHDNPHLKSLKKWNSRLTWRPQVGELSAKEEMSQMSPRDYRDAFSVVHFLIHGPPEAREIFRSYLKEIEDGGAPDPLELQLSKFYSKPDVAVIEHIRAW